MKSDNKVIISFLGILLCLAIILLLLDRSASPTPPDDTYAAVEDTLLLNDNDDSIPAPQTHSLHPQPFDPNTASAALLRTIGLTDFQIRCIINYRNKGGVYQKAEDFARVPSLTQGVYKALLPYITISDDYRSAAELVPPRTLTPSSAHRDTLLYPLKLSRGEHININDADTTMLKKVPGIGSYYARKIVEWRTRLGGFVSLEQLHEIKGLPNKCYEYFVIRDGGITKININAADFSTLRAHPYIGYSRARQIMDYRRLKGAITTLQQLALLPGFSDDERQRLEPYISY